MRRESAAISPVAEVIQAVRAGEIVILVDDEALLRTLGL